MCIYRQRDTQSMSCLLSFQLHQNLCYFIPLFLADVLILLFLFDILRYTEKKSVSELSQGNHFLKGRSKDP